MVLQVAEAQQAPMALRAAEPAIFQAVPHDQAARVTAVLSSFTNTPNCWRRASADFGCKAAEALGPFEGYDCVETVSGSVK